jgi:hypothetical protein
VKDTGPAAAQADASQAGQKAVNLGQDLSIVFIVALLLVVLALPHGPRHQAHRLVGRTAGCVVAHPAATLAFGLVAFGALATAVLGYSPVGLDSTPAAPGQLIQVSRTARIHGATLLNGCCIPRYPRWSERSRRSCSEHADIERTHGNRRPDATSAKYQQIAGYLRTRRWKIGSVQAPRLPGYVRWTR